MSSRELDTNKDKTARNNSGWLKAIPVKGLTEVELPEGTIALLIPRFRRWPLSKWLQPRLKRPHIKLKLDEVGSYVWRICDGETTVGDIAEKVRGHFPGKSEDVEARLKGFLNTLYRSRFVSYVIRDNT